LSQGIQWSPGLSPQPWTMNTLVVGCSSFTVYKTKLRLGLAPARDRDAPIGGPRLHDSWRSPVGL